MFWISLAFAVEPARFPLSAPVQLPATGTVSIDVPVGLRSQSDPDDGSDLWLVDGSGGTVPFAVVRSDDHSEWVRGQQASSIGDVRWKPFPDGSYSVTVRGVDALEVKLLASHAAAMVEIDTPSGTTLKEPVWKVDGGVSPPLQVPDRKGEYTVRVIGPRGPMKAEFNGLRYTSGGQVLTERVPTGAPERLENGWLRYPVPGARGRPVTSLTVHPASALFERDAVAVWGEPGPSGATRIRRMELDGRKVEFLTLKPRGTGRGLSVLVKDAPGAPLQIPEVSLMMARETLVVRKAGPGPHTLYAGAPRGTSQRSDIQFASRELAKTSQFKVSPGPAGPNPAYEPPEVRDQLVQPTSEIDLAGFSMKAAVTGAPGLVRIPLPPRILAAARPDHADLRLVDTQGRQIPYVTTTSEEHWDWGDLTQERKESGQTSEIRMPLPEAGQRLGSIELATTANAFDRSIEIAHVTGGSYGTLRAARWASVDNPGPLRLRLNERVDGDLMVIVNNHDNPPLPITSVRVSWVGEDLVAYLPEGGATLYVGDPRRDGPVYDLDLHENDLIFRATRAAEVGEVKSVLPIPVAWSERMLVLGGVGVLGLGLLGLMLALLKSAPREDEGEDDEGEDDEGVDHEGEANSEDAAEDEVGADISTEAPAPPAPPAELPSL